MQFLGDEVMSSRFQDRVGCALNHKVSLRPHVKLFLFFIPPTRTPTPTPQKGSIGPTREGSRSSAGGREEWRIEGEGDPGPAGRAGPPLLSPLSCRGAGKGEVGRAPLLPAAARPARAPSRGLGAPG